MSSWKGFKHLIIEGGLSDIVIYLVGGWQIVLAIMMGAMFVFSAGLLFEEMKKYQALRRITGSVAVFGFVVLCMDTYHKLRGNESRHESIEKVILSKDLDAPTSVPEIGQLEEVKETTESAKPAGAK